jgi:hypothetical protein
MFLPARARLQLVAPVIVMASVLGAACTGTPSSTSSQPDLVPSATSTPSTPPLAAGIDGPGAYRLTGAEVNGTITVPAGWENVEGWGVKKGDGDAFMAVVVWPNDGEVAQVYADPCQWARSFVRPPVGPTIDDLANALAAQPQRGDAVPVSVTVDGHDGKHVEMSVPSDIDFADCDDGSFRSWAGRYHQGPGQVDDVNVLDVDGQRAVLIAHYMPRTSPADRAQQQAIVDSIDFLP